MFFIFIYEASCIRVIFDAKVVTTFCYWTCWFFWHL